MSSHVVRTMSFGSKPQVFLGKFMLALRRTLEEFTWNISGSRATRVVIEFPEARRSNQWWRASSASWASLLAIAQSLPGLG
jgi:hypothetical protein